MLIASCSLFVNILVKPHQDPRPEQIYGRTTEDEKAEYFDDEITLAKKLDELADLVRRSKHCIIFTGAGISTSTGIPDFRSGMNTVLKTGPGAWELRDRKASRSKNSKVTGLLQAIPSATHMAILQLQQRGYVKFVVSQNVDGLHLRSGLDPEALSELHGNTNLESCVKCGSKFLRDFRTRSAKHVYDHQTDRRCANSKCGGVLHDSIVNFGENLPEYDLEQAYLHASKADLCICLGSSLTVSPANEIPEQVARRRKLVICNLQKTPLHGICDLPLHAMCDDIMVGLLDRLKLPLERWQLKRRIRIVFTSSPSGLDFKLIGLDLLRELPYSLFKKVLLSYEASDEGKINVIRTLVKEPFAITFKPPSIHGRYFIEMHFHGHYAEPPSEISVKIEKDVSFQQDVLLLYDLDTREWESQFI